MRTKLRTLIFDGHLNQNQIHSHYVARGNYVFNICYAGIWPKQLFKDADISIQLIYQVINSFHHRNLTFKCCMLFHFAQWRISCFHQMEDKISYLWDSFQFCQTPVTNMKLFGLVKNQAKIRDLLRTFNPCTQTLPWHANWHWVIIKSARFLCELRTNFMLY